MFRYKILVVLLNLRFGFSITSNSTELPQDIPARHFSKHKMTVLHTACRTNGDYDWINSRRGVREWRWYSMVNVIDSKRLTGGRNHWGWNTEGLVAPFFDNYGISYPKTFSWMKFEILFCGISQWINKYCIIDSFYKSSDF